MLNQPLFAALDVSLETTTICLRRTDMPPTREEHHLCQRPGPERSTSPSRAADRPVQATRRYRCQYAVVYDEACQLRFDVPPEDSARRCEMFKPSTYVREPCERNVQVCASRVRERQFRAHRSEISFSDVGLPSTF